MSKPALLAWWPIAMSAVAVVGSAATTISTVTDLRRAVDAIEQRQQQHERAPGHPEEMARLRAVEIEVAKSSQKSAQAAEAIQDRLRAIDINLALVCRATKGADCVR